MKVFSKHIFAIFGCAGTLGTAQDALPSDPLASVENGALIGSVPAADDSRVPVAPEPVAVSGAPVVESVPSAKEEGRSERKWKVTPFAGVGFSWTDNLFISATRPRSDFFAMISPGLAVGWGDYAGEIRQLGSFTGHFEPLELDRGNLPKNFLFGKYNVNAFFYANNGNQNTVDHDGTISGRWEGGKLTIGGRFYVQTLSDMDIEVGNRAERTVYGGQITSSYALTGKTSLDLNFYNRSFDYARRQSWQEWMVEDWFNYQILPKTRVSLGTRVGLVNVKAGATQTFEQVVGRAEYFPSGKLGFSLNGGVEWRQFGDGGRDGIFGVFNFAATYAPFDGTQVALQAFRRNSASVVLSDENITATGISALVRQRFLQRYFLTVEGGYERSDYRLRRSGPGAGREDETTYVRASVSFDLTKNLSGEVAFQHRQNDSSRQDLSFTENVISVQCKLRL